MRIETLYPPYSIEFAEMDECPKPSHKHSFFELVYIIEGSGQQCINDNHYTYKPGQMFLITPQDCHSFNVESVTKFFFVQFNDVYIKSQAKMDASDRDRVKRMEFILHNATHQPGCILCDPGDKLLVKTLVQSLAAESINRNIFHQEMTDQLVNTIITIVARNIALKIPANLSGSTDKPAVSLVNYIQDNIYFPEQLRMEVMSEKLGMSEGYLGRYFKKHIGESIQTYITNYKLKLVETRLQFSNMRINEIVTEFGFTDESHLNRLFRKHKGISPSAFRKQNSTRATVEV